MALWTITIDKTYCDANKMSKYIALGTVPAVEIERTSGIYIIAFICDLLNVRVFVGKWWRSTRKDQYSITSHKMQLSFKIDVDKTVIRITISSQVKQFCYKSKNDLIAINFLEKASPLKLFVKLMKDTKHITYYGFTHNIFYRFKQDELLDRVPLHVLSF